MKITFRNILLAIVLLLFCCAGALWLYARDGARTLEQATAQAQRLQKQLLKYEELKNSDRGQALKDQSLFSLVSQIGTELKMREKMESLRPATEKGTDILELQLRNLYLREFLAFLSRVEGLDNVIISRLSVNRTTTRQLDIDLRITRRQNESS